MAKTFIHIVSPGGDVTTLRFQHDGTHPNNGKITNITGPLAGMVDYLLEHQPVEATVYSIDEGGNIHGAGFLDWVIGTVDRLHRLHDAWGADRVEVETTGKVVIPIDPNPAPRDAIF